MRGFGGKTVGSFGDIACFSTYVAHYIVTGLVRRLEDRGIETRDMMPLLNQPVYRKIFGDPEPRYPVARWINKNGFYVGCRQHPARKDLNYIIEVIHGWFLKTRKLG